MTWFYFATSSIIFFTVMNLIQRRLAVDSKYQRATSVVFNFYSVLIALTIFIFSGSYKNIVWPRESVAWIFLISASIFYSLYERGRFVAAKLLDASTLTIVSNISVVVAFIGALFLYSESLTVNKAIGAGLIFISLIVVSIQKNIHKKISIKGLLVGILISTVLGLGWMLDKKGAIFFSPSVYNILAWTIPFILLYLPYVKTDHIVYEVKHSSKGLFIMAGLNVVGYYLQLQALQLADATLVIPIVQMSTLTTVLAGVFVLGEKDFIWRKIFSAIVALIGVYLLTIG